MKHILQVFSVLMLLFVAEGLHAQDLYVGGGAVFYTSTSDTVYSGGNTQVAPNGAITANGYFLQNGNLANDGTNNMIAGKLEFGGSAPQLHTGSSTSQVGTLIMNNVLGLTSTNEIDVYSVASFKAGIISGSDSINPIGFMPTGDVDPAFPASDPSHVNGTVLKYGTGAFTYPVGDTSYYRPVLINMSRNDNGMYGTYTRSSAAALGPVSAPLQAVSAYEYWDLKPQAEGVTEATVTLNWDGSKVGSGVLTDAGVANVAVGHLPGTSWISEGGVGTGTAMVGTVTSANTISTWSPFAIGTLQAMGVLVSPKALLQGAMIGTGTVMSTTLKDLNVIPTTQPYNTAPFNYAGTENVISIPAGVTDWVLVELRDPNTPTTVLATRAAFIKSDGGIVDIDGTSPVTFTGKPAGNYYVAIRHRNHLLIRTAVPQALSSTAISYDFTTAQSLAYQNASNTVSAAMKDLGNGKFAMWGGDGNYNGRVSYVGSSNDETYLSSTILGGNTTTVLSNIYSNGDYNMNGRVSYVGASNDETFLSSTVLAGITTIMLYQHL